MAQPGWVKVAAVAAAAMGLGLAWPHFGNRAEAQFGPSAGRYSIVARDNFAILMDTTTGRTWRMQQLNWTAMAFPDGSATPPGSR